MLCLHLQYVWLHACNMHSALLCGALGQPPDTHTHKAEEQIRLAGGLISLLRIPSLWHCIFIDLGSVVHSDASMPLTGEPFILNPLHFFLFNEKYPLSVLFCELGVFHQFHISYINFRVKS